MTGEKNELAKRKTELKAGLSEVINALMEEAKKRNRYENISFAIIVSLDAANQMFYGEEIDDARLEDVAKAVDQLFGTSLGMDNVQNADKQRFVDSVLLSSWLLYSVHKEAVASRNHKSIKESEDGMLQLIRFWGANKENLRELAYGDRQ
ncbi:MAG: hypothetical protein LBI35_03405 [Burkholderiales bacterium]|nr:hypothetical protein [Burkholderiales bacterium]